MTSTVTSKGQVTLPIKARKLLGIRAGTRLEFVVKDESRLEIVVVSETVKSLKGILPKPRKALSLEEMEKAIHSGATRSK